MVKGSQVKSDCDEIVNSLGEASSQVGGIGQNWTGESFDSFISKFEEFINEYKSGIESSMNAFASACDLYEQYATSKSNLETAKTNYSAAKEKYESDKTSANKTAMEGYETEVNTYTNEMSELKTKIDAELLTASSTKFTAEAATAGGLATSIVEAITGTSTTSDTSSSTVDLSGLDMDNYPTGSSYEDVRARAVLIAKYLMANGGFTKEQAAALVGVYWDENKCTPNSFMGAEKSGKGASLTKNGGYGAGIGSWTGNDYKRASLKDAGFPANTPIESLSLKQQCDMVIAESRNSRSTTYNALRRCTSLEDASATSVVMIGAPGFYNNWKTGHPTASDAKRVANFYANSNDKRFGYSDYHHNLDIRRLNYAREIYKYL